MNGPARCHAAILNRSRRQYLRSGVMLLEVLIALAIFAGSLAAIGQVISVASRAASQANWRTESALLAESRLAEVISGVAPLKSTSAQPCVENEDWLWSMSVDPGPATDVLQIEVRLDRARPLGLSADSFSLVRLIRDPQALEAAMLTTTNASSGAGSTSGPGSTSSSFSSGSSR